MAEKNWTKLFSDYKGQWVALEDDEITVISSDRNLAKVIRSAQTKGYQNPIIAKIPQKDITYVGDCHEPRPSFPLQTN